MNTDCPCFAMTTSAIPCRQYQYQLEVSKSETVQAPSVLLLFGLSGGLGLYDGTNVGVVLVVLLDFGLLGGFAAFGSLLDRLLVAVIVVSGSALLASLASWGLSGSVGVSAATVSIVRTY